MHKKIPILICLFVMLISKLAVTQSIKPEMWKIKYHRKDIAPKSWIDTTIWYNNETTLALSGDGKAHANGCWTCRVDIDPDVYYRFTTHFHYQKVADQNRSILARVIWFDPDEKQIGCAEYPATLSEKQDNWYTITQVYRSPVRAASAVLELVYRWAPEGVVHFGGTSFETVSKPVKRLVRMASIHHRPRQSISTQANLEEFARFVDQAGIQDADIVCLPEGITRIGTGKSYQAVCEPVPGPSTQFLGRVAKKNQLYLIAGLYEREDDAIYNTAVLINRNGDLTGKYRKVCLPREEIQGGITPGNSFPTFQTDFGCIGMMICWDVTFPEVARMLRMNGAEVIFMPIWGGNLTLAKARAIENQVYLVSSSYDMKSAVFDLKGNVLAEATDEDPVVVTEVDLAEQKLWNWLGDLKNRIPREMPPKETINKGGLQTRD